MNRATIESLQRIMENDALPVDVRVSAFRAVIIEVGPAVRTFMDACKDMFSSFRVLDDGRVVFMLDGDRYAFVDGDGIVFYPVAAHGPGTYTDPNGPGAYVKIVPPGTRPDPAYNPIRHAGGTT
jgi:hypothetical protein